MVLGREDPVLLYPRGESVFRLEREQLVAVRSKQRLEVEHAAVRFRAVQACRVTRDEEVRNRVGNDQLKPPGDRLERALRKTVHVDGHGHRGVLQSSGDLVERDDLRALTGATSSEVELREERRLWNSVGAEDPRDV